MSHRKQTITGVEDEQMTQEEEASMAGGHRQCNIQLCLMVSPFPLASTSPLPETTKGEIIKDRSKAGLGIPLNKR